MEYQQDPNLCASKLFSDLGIDSPTDTQSSTFSMKTPKTSSASTLWQMNSSGGSHGNSSVFSQGPLTSNFLLSPYDDGGFSRMPSGIQAYNHPASNHSYSYGYSGLTEPTPLRKDVPDIYGFGDDAYSSKILHQQLQHQQHLQHLQHQHPQQQLYYEKPSEVRKNSFATKTREQEEEISRLNNELGKNQRKLQSLTTELKTKNQTVENLQELLGKNEKAMSEQLKEKGNFDSPSTVEVPTKYVTLFNDLSNKYKLQTKELEETKLRLEAIITAISMNPQRTQTVEGVYDEEEVAHKIVVRLKVLAAENESLLKMISCSNKPMLLAEIELLKDTNLQLEKKMNEIHL